MDEWRDVEGKFSCDYEGKSWSFEGAGRVPIANTKGGAIVRDIVSASGDILQTWDYEGRRFFFGQVTNYGGRPVAGLRKPMIQGSIGEWDGIVTLYLGTPQAIHVSGLLETPLSGAEPADQQNN